MFDLVPFRRKNQNGLRRMLDTFDDFFNDDFFSPIHPNTRSFRADIREKDGSYLIEAELPGFDKEDVNVEYADHYLTIQAARNNDIEEKNDNQQFIRRERFYGEYVRRFYVGDVEEDKIKAAFKDGVLRLTLPKKESEIEPTRRIEIE